MVQRLGKPMNYRQRCVEFDRKTAIGCRNENSFTSDTPRFPEKLRLLLSSADMLQNRSRMDEIKVAVSERQIPPVRPHEPDTRIHRFDKLGIVEPDGGNLGFVKIPDFKIIGVIVTSIARDSHIENSVAGLDLHGSYKMGEHLTTLMPGNLDR